MKRTACLLGWLMVVFGQVNLEAQTVGSFRGSEQLNSEYIEITQKRLLTIVVTNRVRVKPPIQPFVATIINQIPLPVCWRDGKTYEGLTNLSFYPTPPKTISLKPGAEPTTKKITPQTWQSVPRDGYQWEWRLNGAAGQEIVTTCRYQIVTAHRRLRTEKIHLSLADFKELPPHLQKATAQVRASLPANVIALAQSLAGDEKDPLKIIKRFSDWAGQHVRQEANDLNGKFITRYNIEAPFKEGRGWCGPRSSAFRALCLSYGIPAREVSGYSFQNITDLHGAEINRGNAHVWAEAFLPQIGWVEISSGQGIPDCFNMSPNDVAVYGTESPEVDVYNKQGVWLPFEQSQTVSVSSKEIPSMESSDNIIKSSETRRSK